MEKIEYEMPDSWNAKGMNWDDPDPQRVDYVMAIRAALMERAAALHVSLPREVMRLTSHAPVSRTQVASLVAAVRELCPKFVNATFEDYREDMSDFPKMWTYRELIREEGCELYGRAGPGMMCRGGGGWLRAIRNAVDRLTVIPANVIYGTSVSRSGDIHDPPFDESISTALANAEKMERRSKAEIRFPLQVFAWSGNTHYRPPLKGDEESSDGYCGYARGQSYECSRMENWLFRREFDLRLYVESHRPEGPGDYADELEASVFDSGRTGIRDGRGWLKPVHVKDSSKLELLFGDATEIPKNATVPTSTFADDDDPDGETVRRSAKAGYFATYWALMDYGVENGFRFRKED